MKKNAKIIIVLVIAVVMALLAGSAVISFLNPHRETIYTFKSAYTIGTQITSSMLVPMQVDSTIVNGGTSSNVSSQFVTSKEIRALLESGDSLKMDVTAGMPLMKSLLSIQGGNSILMTMKPSSVAVTVDVDNTTGITSNLYTGAAVNVYVTSYSGGTFLLFENMRVLAITRNSSGALTTVTLEVSNEEAVKLINSSKNGSIHLGLINTNGYVYEEGTSEILVNPESQSSSNTTTSESSSKNNETDATDVIEPETDKDEENEDSEDTVPSNLDPEIIMPEE